MKTIKHNFMSLQIGEKFRHIDFDDERIFTKVTRGRYRDQFGFEDFMMDALTERWVKVEDTANQFVKDLVEIGNGIGGIKMTEDKEANLELIKGLLKRSKDS